MLLSDPRAFQHQAVGDGERCTGGAYEAGAHGVRSESRNDPDAYKPAPRVRLPRPGISDVRPLPPCAEALSF